MKPRILLLVHHEKRDVGRAKGLLESAGFSTRVCNCSGETAPHKSSYEGMIVFGGGVRIDEGRPWLSRELVEIEGALERKPVFGICLGAQIICHLLGGKIERAPVGEFGFPLVYQTERDALLQGLPRQNFFYSFHEDWMIPPKGARVFLRSDLAPQGIRFGPLTAGVQFHPEITLPLALWRNHKLGFLLREVNLRRAKADWLALRYSPMQRRSSRRLLCNWAREAKREIG